MKRKPPEWNGGRNGKEWNGMDLVDWMAIHSGINGSERSGIASIGFCLTSE